MKIGIIGYPKSGKTTFFSALAGIDPQQNQTLWEVKVPDQRIDALSKMYQPKKTIYATVQFEDIMAQTHHSQKGLDPQIIGKIRELDLISIVVRDFESPFVAEAADPIKEAQAMLADLLIADLDLVERKMARLKKERATDKEKDLFKRCQQALEAETWLRDIELSDNELETLRGYQLLTLKPVIFVLNVEESLADESKAQKSAEKLANLPFDVFALSAQVEGEIAQLPADEQLSFLADLGISATARDRFVRTAYTMLDLISFFTVGEDEVRAWTVKRGATAQESAGKIHTDLAKHFIRAERMTAADLLELGSEAKVKEAGKFELKGRSYITQDGDILHIRANA